MDYKGAKFFRLNYLCSNTPNSFQNQKKLTIEKTIHNDNKIRRIKSNIISVSQNFSTQNYKKIDNSKNLLNKNISPNISNDNKQKLIRTKSNYEKTFNDIYSSYFIERTPLTKLLQENNSSNKKIYKKRNYNNDNDNFKQLNFTINNFIPVVDSQYLNQENKNKSYCIEIDNPYNSRNKNDNKNLKIKEKTKNIKSILCINNNFKDYKYDNNKENEFKQDNKYKNNLSILNISNINDTNINDKKSSKFDLSKFLNDKNSIRLLIKNKRKLRNFKIKNNQKLLNNKTEFHSINLSNNSYLNKLKNKENNKNKNIEKIKKENFLYKLKRNKEKNKLIMSKYLK